MNFKITALGLLLLSSSLFAQESKKDFKAEVKKHQTEMNTEFSSEDHSPLLEKDRIEFKKLDFFKPNQAFKVTATFKRTPDEEVFKMKTSTERAPEYVKYGEVTFTLDGKEYKLNIYQNVKLVEKEEYKDYLFMPFTDLTNGESTYGGGRYIDLKIPEGDKIVIDFNKAYNPYCAYSHKYSCPIPPKENHLLVEVKAGVKAFENDDH